MRKKKKATGSRKSAKKPARKKARQKSRRDAAPQAAKRRRFVKGLIAGKSMRRAALDAGYTESMADNAGQKIMPYAIAEFRAELQKRIPIGLLTQRIREGLDAEETKFFQQNGKVMS